MSTWILAISLGFLTVVAGSVAAECIPSTVTQCAQTSSSDGYTQTTCATISVSAHPW